VLHCGTREFRAFCCCDLDLDPMSFIYKSDPYAMKICPQSADQNELSTSMHSKVIVVVGLHYCKHRSVSVECYFGLLIIPN